MSVSDFSFGQNGSTCFPSPKCCAHYTFIAPLLLPGGLVNFTRNFLLVHVLLVVGVTCGRALCSLSRIQVLAGLAYLITVGSSLRTPLVCTAGWENGLCREYWSEHSSNFTDFHILENISFVAQCLGDILKPILPLFNLNVWLILYSCKCIF
jgi:hypothetical protein